MLPSGALGTVGQLPAACLSHQSTPLACALLPPNQVHQEVELHRVLDVDWVVPFWVAVDEGSQLHIVTQFCQQSDLRSSLAASGPLSEAHVRDQVVIPLLHALRELHSKVRGAAAGGSGGRQAGVG